MFFRNLQIKKRPTLLIFITLCSIAWANGDKNNLQSAPQSEAFIKWSLNFQNAENKESFINGCDLIPDPVDWSHLMDNVHLERAPESYDLRDEDGVTIVQDRGDCESGWAFSTYGSMESILLRLEEKTYDFSEQHMKNTHGFDFTHCGGGNSAMSIAYLTRWQGPVYESDNPYDINVDNSSDTLEHQKIITSVLKFTGKVAIKDALVQYGALYTALHWKKELFNESENTYVYLGAEGENSSTCIVGWDNSKVVTGATANGAWLMKNSKGTSWGDNGYFWVSFEDVHASKIADAFIGVVSPDTYSHVYSYCPLGLTTSFGYSKEECWGANVFTAVNDDSLCAVGLYALASNTEYEINIYDDFINNAFENKLGSTSGTLLNAGYHTISLTKKIKLTNNDNFCVVVKFVTPSSNSPLALEHPLSNYSSKATSQKGQSFISSTGSFWTDVTSVQVNSNVCISALTSSNFAPVINPVGNVSVDEGAVLSFVIKAEDKNGDKIALSCGNLPDGAVFTDGGNDSASFSWTPEYNQSGTYDLSFVASDGTLSDSENIIITVTNSNRSPEIAAIDNKNITEGDTVLFTVTAQDPDGDAIVLTASNIPAGSLFDSSTGKFKWITTSTDAGEYKNIVFTATDDGAPPLSDDVSISIIVVDVNNAPILASIGDKQGVEAQSIEFNVSATDVDNNPVTISMASPDLPDYATFNGQVFKWIPSFVDSGKYSATFSVTDGNDTARETILFSIANVNRKPTLSFIGNKSVIVENQITFPVYATDHDKEKLVIIANGIPQGAVFTDNTNDTGSFVWTPTISQVGTFPIVFSVTDGIDTSRETITVVVSDNITGIIHSDKIKTFNEYYFHIVPNILTVTDKNIQLFISPDLKGKGYFSIYDYIGNSVYSEDFQIYRNKNNVNPTPYNMNTEKMFEKMSNRNSYLAVLVIVDESGRKKRFTVHLGFKE